MILAGDLDPADIELIRRLVPPTPSPYHRLNPLTKAIIATVGSIGAFAAGGYVGPIAIDVVMVLLALRAGVLGQLARVSLLLTLPTLICRQLNFSKNFTRSLVVRPELIAATSCRSI